MTLLGMNVEERDLSRSEAACKIALAILVTDRQIVPAPTTVTASTTLGAFLTGIEPAISSGPRLFTEMEQGLLVEWLDRFTRSTSVSNGKSARAELATPERR